jgi:hypothetical protein
MVKEIGQELSILITVKYAYMQIKKNMEIKANIT